MANGNYLNLKNGERDSYVYRVMPLKRLYGLFTDKRNVLVRPSKWEDPFEDFILKARVRMRDGTVATFGFNNEFFGQCWTRQKSSDAIWRIYSPDKTSVRVRTTVRRLYESLDGTLAEWAHVQAFIGKVRYLRDQELVDFGNGVFLDGLNPVAVAETLLVKRKAFVHEREVRLLYLEENRSAQDLYSYDLDPHVLIDQIMIDPRLAKEDVAMVKDEIRRKTGFKGKIMRSLLYAPPDSMFFPIG